MKGLNLEVLRELSEQLGMEPDQVTEAFEALEAEGNVFRALDEVSGKVLWFPIQELDGQDVQ